MADLWTMAIGEREQFKETGEGLERLHVVPLLLLHRRRIATFAGKELAARALSALRRRFPDARLLSFPGGADDALVVTDEELPQVLDAYGLVPWPAPKALAPALEWARQPGPPEQPLPAELDQILEEPELIPTLARALARDEVSGRRALALVAATGTAPAQEFLAWALAADDAEFQAKFRRRGQDAIAAIAYLPDHAAEGFTRRVLWDTNYSYPWRTLRACVERMVRLGPAGLSRLHELGTDHLLEPHIQRWMSQSLKRREPGDAPGS